MNEFLSNHFFEISATLCALLNVYLAAKENIWNWFFGIIAVSLYLVIFFQVKLYADMGLQLIFFYFQFYGLYQWLYGGEKRTILFIKKSTQKIFFKAFFTTIALYVSIAYILKHYTDSTTIHIDAFITALSIVAQWMMSKKWLEHWILWIIVDIVSVHLYFSKNLYFTSGLYGVFCLLGIAGYMIWKNEFNKKARIHGF